jgi:hypothetical protein
VIIAYSLMFLYTTFGPPAAAPPPAVKQDAQIAPELLAYEFGPGHLRSVRRSPLEGEPVRSYRIPSLSDPLEASGEKSVSAEVSVSPDGRRAMLVHESRVTLWEARSGVTEVAHFDGRIRFCSNDTLWGRRRDGVHLLIPASNLQKGISVPGEAADIRCAGSRAVLLRSNGDVVLLRLDWSTSEVISSSTICNVPRANAVIVLHEGRVIAIDTDSETQIWRVEGDSALYCGARTGDTERLRATTDDGFVLWQNGGYRWITVGPDGAIVSDVLLGQRRPIGAVVGGATVLTAEVDRVDRRMTYTITSLSSGAALRRVPAMSGSAISLLDMSPSHDAAKSAPRSVDGCKSLGTQAPSKPPAN